jgi:hypothetical protein
MFMFRTQKCIIFVQNYITIITKNYLKSKSYIFHAKTSQVKQTYHLHLSNIYFLCHFLQLKAHKFFMDIVFYDFHMNFIEIS